MTHPCQISKASDGGEQAITQKAAPKIRLPISLRPKTLDFHAAHLISVALNNEQHPARSGELAKQGGAEIFSPIK
jgi:hypothetical protein